MSPDPPADDTHDDELINNTGVYFMPIPEDDDFMGDEDDVHQLDYNTQDDSDFSDDENARQEQGNHNPENNNSTEPVTRMMAHYQLLIPFPPSEILEPSSSDDGSSGGAAAEQMAPVIKSLEETTITENTVSTSTSNKKAVEETTQREINLTEDNVELIKNVMKGFSLPPSCIPTWAEQIDETSWKERLTTSIGRKPSGPHSPPKSGSSVVGSIKQEFN